MEEEIIYTWFTITRNKRTDSYRWQVNYRDLIHFSSKRVCNACKESVTAAAGAADIHIDICPHNNNIDIDFILL